MIKIKKKLKFIRKESRMENEGNILNSRSFFYSKKSKNLYFLIEKRFSWMNRFIKPDHKGLEVGAGAGFSKEFIKCKNFKISDYADFDFLDHKNVNVLKMPFPNNTFDFVISSNVIHHVPYPMIFLEEIRRVLKSNGKLIIQDVNCSLAHQILILLMKHEGFNFESNVFDKDECSTDKNDLWSGNNAIPNLLFDNMNKFNNKVPGFTITHHSYSECLCFMNSGGVISKVFYLPMNRFFLNFLHLIDKILTKFLPSIFAFQRQIVLIKN